jgi:hypothetical protein
MEPRRGRKALVYSIFLSPWQGSALLSGSTPGLRRGYSLSAPPGLALWAEQLRGRNRLRVKSSPKKHRANLAGRVYWPWLHLAKVILGYPTAAIALRPAAHTLWE